ncbi:hypothetical protein M569_14793, partial [Genlisea aurea]
EERELERQVAAGSCPYCGGRVVALAVERRWRFCFLPVGFVIKRKFICSNCSRNLVLY